ncbi:CU044_5270 family protein [Promicromonospora sp. NPDC019610]|uniref:CU044_5270 family protein n=1 Tax=Promicromonospora sp. NPDC019610 TaxID=3364405 RepID=UPI003798F1EE
MTTSTRTAGQEPGAADVEALHALGVLLDPSDAGTDAAFRSAGARLAAEIGSAAGATREALDGRLRHAPGTGRLRAMEAPGDHVRPGRRRRPGSGRQGGGARRPAVRAAVGLGVAATVAGGLLLAPTVTLTMPWEDDGGAVAVPPASASAAEILQAAATRTVVAADDAWDHVRPDQFVYEHTTGTTRYEIVSENPKISLETEESELWTSVDGTQDGLSAGRFADEPYEEYQLFTCAGDGLERARAAGGDCSSEPGLDLDAPTDADAMYDYLRDQPPVEGEGSAASMFIRANDLLGSLTPGSQAAVFEALSRVEGLIVTPGVTDAIGRPGIAVGVELEYYRQDLIFDPETKDLLGVANSYPDGMADAYAIVERTIVDEVGATP